MHIDASMVRLERSQEGVSFLFEERFGFVYLLNDTGYEMAKLMTEGNPSLEEIAVKLADKFDIGSEEHLRADILDFINMLRGYALIS